MVSLRGETTATKVVAIEPILGSVKYEARSNYHSVLEEIIYIQESVYICQRDHDGYMLFEEMGSDKISTI